MRIRSIKPEFWSDSKLTRVSRDARLLFIALWNQADEWARVNGDLRWVKGHCLPFDDDVTFEDIDGLLAELAGMGRVVRYVVDGDPFLFLPTLGKHQRLEPHKTPSRLPDPVDSEIFPEQSEKIPENITVRSRPSDSPLFPQVQEDSEKIPDLSEKNADHSGQIVVQQVAGSMEHVAGSRLENPGTPADKSAASAPETDRFEEFWEHYPRRASRGQAVKAWIKATKKVSPTRIIAATVRYANDPNLNEVAYLPYPASWLNAEGWDNPPEPVRNQASKPSTSNARVNQAAAAVESLRRQGVDTGALPRQIEAS